MSPPRTGFALRLPFEAAAIQLWVPRTPLPAQLISLLLVVFPLMGLSLGTGRLSVRTAGEAIRVVSYSISYGGG